MKNRSERVVKKASSSSIKTDGVRRVFGSMQGHSLMEVLAALGLSAMVIGAALSLLQTTRQHGLHLISTAQQRLDAHAALSVLAVHGRLAGYGLFRANADPTDMPKALSEVSPQSPPMLARNDPRLAIFGDVGEAWAGVRRSADAPQPVPGSERLKLRYRADKVSVWLSTHNKPANCEGYGLDRDQVVDAYMQILADTKNGEHNLHCATDAWRAAGPLVPNTSSMQFTYWLADEMQPRGVKEMTDVDWAGVIGFDVCLTMQDVVKKTKPRAARIIDNRRSDLNSQTPRNGNDASGRAGHGVGALRCRGPLQHYKSIALRNQLHAEVVPRYATDK